MKVELMFILQYTDEFLEKSINDPKLILSEMIKSNNVIVEELSNRGLWTLDLRVKIITLLKNNNIKYIDEDVLTGDKSNKLNKREILLLDCNLNEKHSFYRSIDKMYDEFLERNLDISPLIDLIKKGAKENIYLKIYNDKRYIDTSFQDILNTPLENRYQSFQKIIFTSDNQEYVKEKLRVNLETIKKYISRFGVSAILDCRLKTGEKRSKITDTWKPLLENGDYDYVDLITILEFASEYDSTLHLLEENNIHQETFFLKVIENKLTLSNSLNVSRESKFNFIKFILENKLLKNQVKEMSTNSESENYLIKHTLYSDIFDSFGNIFFKGKAILNMSEFGEIFEVYKLFEENDLIELYFSLINHKVLSGIKSKDINIINEKIKRFDQLIISSPNYDIAKRLMLVKNNIITKLENTEIYAPNILEPLSAFKLEKYKSEYIAQYMLEKFNISISLDKRFSGYNDHFQKVIRSKNLTLMDYEKNIYYLSMKLNNRITESNIKMEVFNVDKDRFRYKNQMLFDMYEKNLDNISFFWSEHEYLDIQVTNEIYNWFSSNIQFMSNLDLEIMRVKNYKIIGKLIEKELIQRKKEHRFIEKKYILSEEEQYYLFFKDFCEYIEDINIFGLIDFSRIKINFKIDLSMKENKLLNELENNNTVIGEIVRDIKNRLVKCEKFSSEDKFSTTNVKESFQDSINEKDKIYLSEIKSLLNESFLENLESKKEYLVKTMYRNKLSVKEVLNMDELYFWRAFVLLEFFSLEDGNLVLKANSEIQNSRSYLIPQYLHKDKIIESALALYKLYQKYDSNISISPEGSMELRQKIFNGCKENNIIGHDKKMIIYGYYLEVDLKNLDKISFKDMIVKDVRFYNDHSEVEYVKIYEKLFNELEINASNIKDILTKDIIVPEVKFTHNISMSEKMEIFVNLIEGVFLEHSDINKQLNSFCNALDFVGGRREILNYINEHPEDNMLNEKFCLACFYFTSLIAKSENDKRLIDFIRNFEYVAEKSKWNIYSEIFRNPIYNMEGLIREVNLRENLNIRDEEIHKKKKV